LDAGSGNLKLVGDWLIVHVDVDFSTGPDVCSDVLALPFRDRTFNVVYASHLLEHVSNPLAALTELKRVARKAVVVKVPNARYRNADESEEHLFSWNLATFEHLIRKVFVDVDVYKSRRFSTATKKPLLRIVHKVKALGLMLLSGDENELTAVCSLKK